MKRRSVLVLLACSMLTFSMITGAFAPNVYADTAKKSETETEKTEEEDNSSDSKSSEDKKNKKSSEDSKSSDDNKSADDKKSSKKSKSSSETEESEEGSSEEKSDSNTRTVKTATKSSKSSDESTASSKKDANGNTLLMTDSQRRSKFKSKTNPKRGTKPAKETPRPDNGMYSYGNFGTYNSYHSENGLGGTPIYLIGKITDIEKVAENSEGYKAVLMVDDCDGYQWYIRFNVDKADYDQFKKQFTGVSGYLFGIYSGYSGVAYRPMMDLSLIVPNDAAAATAEVPKASRESSKTENAAETPAESKTETATETKTETTTETATEKTSESVALSYNIADKDSKPVDPKNVSREMRSFLDSFEAFMDVYVNFMKNYKSNPANAMTMLNENTSITQQYINYLTKAQAYLGQPLSTADAEYLAAALARIEKKSLEAAQ